MRMIDKHIGSKFSGTDVFIMTGGTRKRGATWSYYFDLGKIDGKRQKKEKGGFKTKKEAETALAKAINEYNNAGAVFTPSEITVSDYLDQWYDLYCKPNLKYSTQVNYLRIIEGHLKPKYGQYRLKAITSAILQEYANSLKLNGLAKSSVVGILSVFGASLDYAVEPMHYLSVNPMRYVKFPKIERKPRERIVLTMDDWNRIIERFPVGSRFHIPLMIGFYTGLRISEAFALTWDDIDLEKRELTVNKQVVVRNFGADVRKVIEKKGKKELRSSWYFTTPKTQSSSRTVKFGETLYQALKQESTTQMENELKCVRLQGRFRRKSRKNWMKRAMKCKESYQFRSAYNLRSHGSSWSALRKMGSIHQRTPSSTVPESFTMNCCLRLIITLCGTLTQRF